MHKSALCRELGMGWGNIGHHLDLLERNGRIDLEQHGTRLWAFQRRLPDKYRGLIVALADENRMELLGHLEGRESATIRELSRDLEYSHKVVRTHLSHLMDAGAVERRGRKPHRYRSIHRFWRWITDD